MELFYRSASLTIVLVRSLRHASGSGGINPFLPSPPCAIHSSSPPSPPLKVSLSSLLSSGREIASTLNQLHGTSTSTVSPPNSIRLPAHASVVASRVLIIISPKKSLWIMHGADRQICEQPVFSRFLFSPLNSQVLPGLPCFPPPLFHKTRHHKDKHARNATQGITYSVYMTRKQGR